VIAIPPVDEQNRIVDHVEHESAKLRLLGEQVERAIELLKEHRSALIAAVVTGKIDVRGDMVECEAA
jgi:type I restriction enzyme S subunit